MPLVVINKWDEGITNDPRNPREGVSRVVTNFDILTDTHRMTPYRQSEDGGADSIADDKKNFAIGLYTASNPDSWRLFGLGVTSSGGAIAEIANKTLEIGGSGDLSDNTWASSIGNASASGTAVTETFIYYHRTGKFYGTRAGTSIWAFTPDNSTAFEEQNQALTYTHSVQGLVHSKDNKIYLPYYDTAGGANAKSFIASWDGSGAWTTQALTLPDHLIITSISEYGNFLAIGCAPVSGLGNSIVYLWNRDDSLTTLSESISWGEGSLLVLEQIDGELVGISQRGGTATVFSAPVGLPIASTSFKDRTTFRRLIGNRAVEILTLEGGTNTTLLPIAKQIINSRLYFMLLISLNGTIREGVWSIGRNKQGLFSVIHERTPDNDTALSGGNLHNFINVGDFLFQSYTTSSAVVLSKTDDQSNFTATSIYESTINPRMKVEDRTRNKQIKAISVSYDSLPTAGQVVLKLKVDGTEVTVFTETTDNQITTERTKNDAGTEFTSGVEFEFRIESTGGAVITELKYEYELIKNIL